MVLAKASTAEFEVPLGKVTCSVATCESSTEHAAQGPGVKCTRVLTVVSTLTEPAVMEVMAAVALLPAALWMAAM